MRTDCKSLQLGEWEYWVPILIFNFFHIFIAIILGTKSDREERTENSESTENSL